MAIFVACERDQAFLLPPDMKDWLPADDLAHSVIAAAERVSMSAFQVNDRNSGKPQYHPRMMLALLVYAYANGLFSSRRIERATHRDLGVRFVTANTLAYNCKSDRLPAYQQTTPNRCVQLRSQPVQKQFRLRWPIIDYPVRRQAVREADMSLPAARPSDIETSDRTFR